MSGHTRGGGAGTVHPSPSAAAAARAFCCFAAAVAGATCPCLLPVLDVWVVGWDLGEERVGDNGALCIESIALKQRKVGHNNKGGCVSLFHCAGGPCFLVKDTEQGKSL